MNPDVTAALVVVTVIALAVVGWRTLRDLAAIEERAVEPAESVPALAQPAGRPILSVVGAPPRRRLHLHLVDPTPAA